MDGLQVMGKRDARSFGDLRIMSLVKRIRVEESFGFEGSGDSLDESFTQQPKSEFLPYNSEVTEDASDCSSAKTQPHRIIQRQRIKRRTAIASRLRAGLSRLQATSAGKAILRAKDGGADPLLCKVAPGSLLSVADAHFCVVVDSSSENTDASTSVVPMSLHQRSPTTLSTSKMNGYASSPDSSTRSCWDSPVVGFCKEEIQQQVQQRSVFTISSAVEASESAGGHSLLSEGEDQRIRDLFFISQAALRLGLPSSALLFASTLRDLCAADARIRGRNPDTLTTRARLFACLLLACGQSPNAARSSPPSTLEDFCSCVAQVEVEEEEEGQAGGEGAPALVSRSPQPAERVHSVRSDGITEVGKEMGHHHGVISSGFSRNSPVSSRASGAARLARVSPLLVQQQQLEIAAHILLPAAAISAAVSGATDAVPRAGGRGLSTVATPSAPRVTFRALWTLLASFSRRLIGSQAQASPGDRSPSVYMASLILDLAGSPFSTNHFTPSLISAAQRVFNRGCRSSALAEAAASAAAAAVAVSGAAPPVGGGLLVPDESVQADQLCLLRFFSGMGTAAPTAGRAAALAAAASPAAHAVGTAGREESETEDEESEGGEDETDDALYSQHALSLRSSNPPVMVSTCFRKSPSPHVTHASTVAPRKLTIVCR